MQRRRVSEFNPDTIAGVPVGGSQTMREARQRLARREAARQPKLPPPPDFDTRLTEAAARVAPEEPVAYRFVPQPGGFHITAITEADLAIPISPKTPLNWPKNPQEK